ncbi:hypothetical protein [Spirosoma sp.]|uniref:hypothetical protein n=1 Tax=Spirosoma sp. TaxID=1899569 RepID=UPI002601EC92|nr:hypothetical protein [Spirosoma sp.]MCX6217656.1 hypothetical protein [Spirosoma sp.]
MHEQKLQRAADTDSVARPMRSVQKPDYSVCNLHSKLGSFLNHMNRLADAADVPGNPRRSVPLSQLPMPF